MKRSPLISAGWLAFALAWGFSLLPGQAQNNPAATASNAATNETTSVAGKLVRAVKELVGTTPPDAETNKVIHIFSGADLNHFYTWLDEKGTFVDPHRVFTVEDGMIHITGERRGYLATKAEYADYRLVVEYKWGEAQWRGTNFPRNSGVFVHATGLDNLWMKSIECQIAEGRSGEVVLHGGSRLEVDGEAKSKDFTTFPRKTEGEVEFLHGKWNTMEITCQGSRLIVKVNGKQTMDAFNAFPNNGKILLQSNEAEIYFRRFDLYPLSETNMIPSKVSKPAE